MEVDRYISGTSLDKTAKEVRLDSLEKILKTEFSDRTYLALRRLPRDVIEEIHRAVMDL